MNLQGYTAASIGNMLNHYTRHNDDPEQARYRYANQNIDGQRTHLNYALFERPDASAFIKRQIASANVKPTASTNVMSDWVVTLPQNDALRGRVAEFFAEAYGCLTDIVGQDNVIGAWVHLDENQPHMHYAFTPLTSVAKMTNDKTRPLRWTKADEKKNPEHKAGTCKRNNRGTVKYERVPVIDENGKPVLNRSFAQTKLFDRARMKSIHPEMEARMERYFGFKVGIQLEDPGERQLSRLEQSDYIAAKATLDRLDEEQKNALHMVGALENLEKVKADECSALSDAIGKANEELAGIRHKRVSEEKTMLRAIEVRDAMNDEVGKLEAIKVDLETEVQELQTQANTARAEALEARRERDGLKTQAEVLREEVAGLEGERDGLRSAIESLKEEMTKLVKEFLTVVHILLTFDLGKIPAALNALAHQGFHLAQTAAAAGREFLAEHDVDAALDAAYDEVDERSAILASKEQDFWNAKQPLPRGDRGIETR